MATSLPPNYAGEITAAQCWAVLEKDPQAQVVDVRTAAEWAFVGGPDLSALARNVHRIEWVSFPAMTANPDFVAEVAAAVPDKDIVIHFLCRSGVRSRAAAIAMTAAGYTNAFNITAGFEGDLNAARQRGTTNGWKATGLPWVQS